LRFLSLEIDLRARMARLGLMSRPRLRRWGRLVARAATSMPLAALAFQLSSCGNGPGQILDPPPPPHVFSTDVEPLLADRCAFSGCHDAETGSADLVLERGQSYDRLVEVPSSQLPSMNRVHPHRPDSSYLFHKLNGSHLDVGGSGVRMPKGGDFDPGLTYSVDEWIIQGAKED
jgi:hypothetical protein